MALAVVAVTTAKVNAQWPTACVDLNDIVEQHLGNHENVGIYQGRFAGSGAEDNCQSDHREDVRAVFAWAFGESLTVESGNAATPSDIGGWPTTCVQLNDIVERHLGNYQNVGIYQRTFDEQAERACQFDHAEDIRRVFAWACHSGLQTSLAFSHPIPEDSLATVGELTAIHPGLIQYVYAMPWLADRSYVWLADGFTTSDKMALNRLLALAAVSHSTAVRVSSFPWFVDGISQDRRGGREIETMILLRRIAQRNPSLLEVILEYEWLPVSASEYGNSAIGNTLDLAGIDLDLALNIARVPWIADGVLRNEALALTGLVNLAVRDLALARQLASYGAEPPTRDNNVSVFHGIDGLTYDEESALLSRLVAQPWFMDGLNPEERALITAIGGGLSNELYDQMISSHFSRTKTITLPLAGQVRLWAFQANPFPPGDNTLEIMEQGVRGAERFMRSPYPLNDVIALVVDDRKDSAGFAAIAEYMRVRIVREGARGLVERSTLIHELAHFYFTNATFFSEEEGREVPIWFTEGGAEFLLAYTNNLFGLEGLDERRQVLQEDIQFHCVDHGLNNLYSLTSFDLPNHRRARLCQYTMGELLLLSLFQTMGEEALSGTVREILEGSIRQTADGITEYDFYQTALRHAPENREDAVRELFQAMHGGPFTGSLSCN